MKSTRRGSILMEFVIVLPIYFILLGSAFVVGELALHSIHLSAQADRGMAYFVELESSEEKSRDSFMTELRNVLSFNTKPDDGGSLRERDYDFQGSDAGQQKRKLSQFEDADCLHIDVVPENSVDHQFTKAVAGLAVDNYTLSPLSRGFIAHWFFESNRRTHGAEGAKMMTETTKAPAEDAIDKILKKGELGRTKVYGNYRYDETGKKVREFGYYSLQRNEKSRLQTGGSKPFRSSDAGALASGWWKELKLVEDDSSEEEEEGERVASVKPSPDQANDGSDIYIIDGKELKAEYVPEPVDSPQAYKFSELL